MKNTKETIMKFVFLLAATVSIVAVILICVFLFASGIPAIGEIGIFDFLFGTQWRPANDLYGILPDDRRFYLCHRRRSRHRSSHRHTDRSIHGQILSAVAV